MSRLEAVDLAVFAGRFLLQRAAQAALEGIQQEVMAFITSGEPGERQPVKLGFFGGYDRFAARVVDPAIDRSELQQDPEILDLLAG